MNRDLEFWLRDDARDDDTGKKFYGVVTGTVRPEPDPLGLSRIAVSLPCIDELDSIPYARIASPAAGLFSGNYFIPNPGDSVLVAFEHGDLNAPYIIGALWHNISRPPVPLAQAQIRTIRTLAGNQIVFTEVPTPTITIQTPTPPGATPAPASPVGPHSSVSLMPGVADISAPSVTLRGGGSTVAVGDVGITLQVGASLIRVGGEGITIAFGTNIIQLGEGGILINGKMVYINPNAA